MIKTFLSILSCLALAWKLIFMADFWYNNAKAQVMTDLNLATDDMRMLLVMSNTTADTDVDLVNPADFGTLDEMDGAGYARKTLAGESVTFDAANNRGEATFTAPVWATLGNGTRAVVGSVLIKFVTNDADSINVAFFDLGSITPGGSDLTLTPNAEGALQIT